MMPNLEPLLIFFAVSGVLAASFGVGYTLGWFRGAGELEATRRELAELQADALESVNKLEQQVRQIQAESDARARTAQMQADRLLYLTRELETAQARRAS
ncbi:MAG: hypothetical protein ACK55O_14325 [Phycisphaerales bacterium]|jgi:hypothetical protein|nr:hypothetical protein [Phycisphaeraceae bacterium]